MLAQATRIGICSERTTHAQRRGSVSKVGAGEAPTRYNKIVKELELKK